MCSKMPLARSHDMIVRELENETLLYDLLINQAVCLSSFTALVWSFCDGKTTIEDALSELSKSHGKPLNRDALWLVLHELEKFNLLEEPIEPHNDLIGLSRREIFMRLSVFAIALPVVAGIVAPTSANAQSGMPPPPACPGCAPGVPLPSGCPCSVTQCSNCVGGVCNGVTGMCT